MTKQISIHEKITNSIIKAMESGTAPWQKPWTGTVGGQFPLRSNGQPYRGINILVLWMAADVKGYSSPYWFTFKQAKDLGASVRKSEKSQQVVKYGTFEKENEDTGEKTSLGYLKSYNVFNAEQIDGLPEDFKNIKTDAEDLGTAANPTLDAFFTDVGAQIVTTDAPRAYYSPQIDRIHMPPINTFHSANGYYGTLSHELTHWTGHAARLDRFNNDTSKQDYAFEELVAELGACFLCSDLGLTPDFQQSAAYIESWLKALKDDPKHIFKAATAAQKAFDLIKECAERKNQAKAA